MLISVICAALAVNAQAGVSSQECLHRSQSPVRILVYTKGSEDVRKYVFPFPVYNSENDEVVWPGTAEWENQHRRDLQEQARDGSRFAGLTVDAFSVFPDLVCLKADFRMFAPCKQEAYGKALTLAFATPAYQEGGVNHHQSADWKNIEPMFIALCRKRYGITGKIILSYRDREQQS